MKIEYIKEINKEKGKKDNIRFKIQSNRTDGGIIELCCEESKKALGQGFFEGMK